MGVQCMMMHVYLPDKYRSPFLLPGLPLLEFGSPTLTASRFCFLEPQFEILITGDDIFSISTCPPEFDPGSLKMNHGVSFMILTTGDDRSFISTCPLEFDPDSLKRNDGANFNCILDCP